MPEYVRTIPYRRDRRNKSSRDIARMRFDLQGTRAAYHTYGPARGDDQPTREGA